MDRGTLDKTIKRLNSSFELTESEVVDFLEFFEIECNEQIIEKLKKGETQEIFKKIVANIEANLKPEDKNYFYDKINLEIYPYIADTERKIEALRKKIDKITKAYIIETLDSDEQKIPFIEEIFPNEKDYEEIIYNMITVINSLSSDKLKLKYLTRLAELNNGKYDYKISMIVQSLKSNELKKQLLHKFSAFYQAEIIMTFDNDEEKIPFLDKFEDKHKAEIIKSFKNDDLKIKQLKNLKKEDTVRVIKSLKSDEEKIRYLHDFEDEDKALIIQSLKDDEKKIELLDRVLDNFAKACIVAKLKNEDKKVDLIDRFKDVKCRYEILQHIRSDEAKRKLLTKDLTEKERFFIFGKMSKRAMTEFFSDSNVQEKYKEMYETYQIIYENKFNEVEQERKYDSFGLPKSMTAGIEIEAEGKKNEIIINAKNLCGNKTKDDGSLENGVEVVSNVMHDTIENIDNIYQTTSVMKQLGLKVSQRCRRTCSYRCRLFNYT